jgi:hypothetical protein
MIIKNFFMAAFVLGLILVPSAADAYESTKQSAVALDATTVLHTIEYEFGFLNADVWLPVRAVRTGAPTTETDLVSYRLETKAGEPYLGGQSYAVALSEAEVVDNKYYFVPKGKRAKFTFVNIARTASASDLADISSRVIALPYTLLKDGAEVKTTHLLAPDALSGYYTPALIPAAAAASNPTVIIAPTSGK